MTIPSFLANLGFTDPATQAAAITGFFILIAILIVGILAIFAYFAVRHDDRAALERHVGRTRDNLLHALRADARTQWRLLAALGDVMGRRDQIISEIEKGRWVQPPYTPFFIRDARTDLNLAVANNIDALDYDLDDTAANYLAEKSLLSQYIDDLRTERFGQLPAEQKIDLVRGYFERLAGFKAACVALNVRTEELLRIKKKKRDPDMQEATS